MSLVRSMSRTILLYPLRVSVMVVFPLGAWTLKGVLPFCVPPPGDSIRTLAVSPSATLTVRPTGGPGYSAVDRGGAGCRGKRGGRGSGPGGGRGPRAAAAGDGRGGGAGRTLSAASPAKRVPTMGMCEPAPAATATVPASSRSTTTASAARRILRWVRLARCARRVSARCWRRRAGTPGTPGPPRTA